MLCQFQVQQSDSGASQVSVGKKIHLQCRRHRRCGFSSWIRKIPWRRAQQPAPVFLSAESHGQRSLAGYSPRGRIESETTEATDHTHTQSDSVLFVRSFLTLQLRHLSPESWHFWLPQGPGCRWSGRTVAGHMQTTLCKPRKVLTLGGCSPVLGFTVSKQDTNGNAVSVCLLGHPPLPRAQLVCLSVAALRMSWSFLSFILKSSGDGERRGCFLGLSFLVYPWIQETNLGLFYQIRSI